MFVVDKEMVGRAKSDENGKRDRENFFFPKQLIFNAEILEMQPAILHTKYKKFLKPEDEQKWYSKYENKPRKVAQENLYEVKDGCMSFPSEKEKQVTRANIIKVKYQTFGLTGLGLRTYEEWISGMKSHIFQHEIDHQKSIDIHMKKNERKMKFIKEDHG